MKKLCDGCKVCPCSLFRLRATSLLQRRSRLQSVMDESRDSVGFLFFAFVGYHVSDETLY